jgi:hypothetical protein
LCEQIKQRIPGIIWKVLQSVHFLPGMLFITAMCVKRSLTTTAFCPYRVRMDRFGLVNCILE